MNNFIRIFFYLVFCYALITKINVFAQASLSGYNAKRTIIPLIPTATPPSDPLSNLVSDGDELISTVYYDELGRPTQHVSQSSSNGYYDIVQIYEYDGFGRQKKQYLPYRSGGNNFNRPRSNPIAELQDFYNTTENVAHDTHPWAEVQYDGTLRNRIVEQGSFGATRQLGTGHTVKRAYGRNEENEVVNWWSSASGTVAPRDGHYYEPGELSRILTEDADGKQSVIYRDNSGKTILTKIQDGDDPNVTSHDGWLCTYNVYDDFGRLRLIIPPGGIEQIDFTSLTSLTFNFMNIWCFQYKYDEFGLLIEKKSPGAEPLFLVYDQWHRLVLTQDGNLRAQGENFVEVTQDKEVSKYNWESYAILGDARLTLTPDFEFSALTGGTFTATTEAVASTPSKYTYIKYDKYNRPIMTGVVSISGTIESIRSQAVSHGSRFELVDNTTDHGYTENLTYPVLTNHTDQMVLSVTYYDNYDFLGQYGFPNWDYVDADGAEVLFDADNHIRILGKVTGTKERILGTGEDDFLFNAVYYDKKYQPIQTIATNHLGGSDRLSLAYNHSGALLKSVLDHTGVQPVTIAQTYEYTYPLRLKRVYHQIDDHDPVLLEELNYNKLGQVISKDISTLQQVDYTYNILGQLSKINGGTTFDDFNDVFGMELKFEDAASGHEQYNGNIGEMQWSGIDAHGNSTSHGYTFDYDASNRLVKANHDANLYNVYGPASNGDEIEYTANGGIKHLLRDHNGTLADQLSYSYDMGNQLTEVDDASDNDLIFKDDDKSGEDYTYDKNGNIVRDLNKGLNVIKYNILNLPEEITTKEGTTIRYTYTASGTKLSRVHDRSSGMNIATDYVAGLQFTKEGDQSKELDIIKHSGGMVKWNHGNPDYRFHLKDHLGNTRKTIRLKKPDLEFNGKTGAVRFLSSYSEGVTLGRPENYEESASGGYSHVYEYFWQLSPDGESSQYGGDQYTVEFAGTVYLRLRTSLCDGAGCYDEAWEDKGYAEIVRPQPNRVTLSADAEITVGKITPVSVTLVSPEFDFYEEQEHFINVLYYWQTTPDGTSTTSHETLKVVKGNSTWWLRKKIQILTKPEQTISDEYWEDAGRADIVFPSVEVLQSNDYYPFGATFQQPLVEEDNKYLYNSVEINLETELYEMEFRGYDPSLGRFMQVDPLTDKMPAYDPYSFGFNNPVVYNDPLGLEPCTAGWWDYGLNTDANTTGEPTYNTVEYDCDEDEDEDNDGPGVERCWECDEFWDNEDEREQEREEWLHENELGGGPPEKKEEIIAKRVERGRNQTSGGVLLAGAGGRDNFEVTADALSSAELAIAGLKPTFELAARQGKHGGRVPYYLVNGVNKSKLLYLGRGSGNFAVQGAKFLKTAAPALQGLAILTNGYDIVRDGEITAGDVFQAVNTGLQVAFPAYGVVYGVVDLGFSYHSGQSLTDRIKGGIDGSLNGGSIYKFGN